jgi:hypothetical protein
MTSQAKRLRQKARYSSADNGTIVAIHAIAAQYHCIAIEARSGITLKYKGTRLWLGTVDDVKMMTLRGLVERF